MLVAAAEQREGLEDQAVLNLLAVSAVVTASGSDGSSSSNGSLGNGGNGGSGGSNGGADSQLAQAAAAGLDAALDEAWRRPAIVARLDGAQVTSLCVVLQRVCQIGASPPPPAALVQAVWRRLAALAQQQQRAWQRGAGRRQARERQQQVGGDTQGAASDEEPASQGGVLSAEQLAVCLFCLSAYPGTPPARLLGAAFGAAAAGVQRLDCTGVWRLAAAANAWAPRVRGRPPRQAAALASALAAEAAAHAGQLEPRSLSAVAQLCTAAGLGAGAAAAGAGAALAAPAARRLAACGNAQEAACAVGWLAPWLGDLEGSQLQQLLAVAMPAGDDGARAASGFFRCATEAAVAAKAGVAQVPEAVLAAALDRLVQSQQLQQRGGTASDAALAAAAAAVTCCSHAAKGNAWPAQAHTAVDALLAAAQLGKLQEGPACELAAALCRAHPEGWEQQLSALQAACLSPPRLAAAPTQQLVDLGAAAPTGSELQGAVLAALAARGAESRLRAARLPELLIAAAREGRRVASGGARQKQEEQQQQLRAVAAPWAGAARACLASLQHRARFLPPPQLLALLEALDVLGIRPQGMLTSAGLQIAASAPVMAPRELASAAARLARLRCAPPLALGAVAAEGAKLAQAGALARPDALRLLWALAKLQHGGPPTRQLASATVALLLGGARLRGGDGDGGSGSGEGHAAEAAVRDDGGAFADAEAEVEAEAPAPLPALAVAAWACGALRLQPARLGDLLAGVTSHPDAPSPAVVSNVLWACARLRLPAARSAVAWGAASMGGLWGEAGPLALANVTWALWKLGECCAPLAQCGAGQDCGAGCMSRSS